MKLQECDYVLGDDGSFYIIRGYWDECLACKVFSPDKFGDRFNNITKEMYSKVIEGYHIPRVLGSYKKYFKPRENLDSNFKDLRGIWKRFYNEILNCGIQKEDVGIMGSYLIGFDVKKDVDFVVYGIENCKLLKSKISSLKKNLGATSITNEHIEYQINKHTRGYSRNNSFRKLLNNKWNSVQISDGILSTIRFVYKEGEILENYFNKKIVLEKIISGEVVEDLNSSFSPRSFVVRTKDRVYTVATYLWIYQTCVKNGTKVKIKGNLREDNIITLDKFSHWIEVLD